MGATSGREAPLDVLPIPPRLCELLTYGYHTMMRCVPAPSPESANQRLAKFDPGLPALPPEHLLGLSWTHFIELIRIDDPLKRAFYEAECLHGYWSIRQLQRQIGSLLYERTGLSTDKESVIRRASSQDSLIPPLVSEIQAATTNAGTRAQGGLTPDLLTLSQKGLGYQAREPPSTASEDPVVNPAESEQR